MGVVPMRIPKPLLALSLFLSIACSPSSPAAPQRPPASVPPRQPATIMGMEGASWLERDDREDEERPEIVLAAMNLRDGDVVADIGAGTGYFARRMARAVGPGGKVYAEEIQPGMLKELRRMAAEEGITNIVTVRGTETDPKLPKGQMDWILLVDVYHEFQKPKAMLEKIRASLKPNGRVALVEYRAEDESASNIAILHRMTAEQVLAEWLPAGFTLVQQIEDLPAQHLFIFALRRGAREVP